MKASLTNRMLEGAGKPSKRILYSDHQEKNLMVVIEPTGKIYWKWQGRIEGKVTQIHLGQFPAMDVAKARRAAGKITDSRDDAKMAGQPFVAPRTSRYAKPVVVPVTVPEVPVPAPVLAPVMPTTRDCQWLWDEYMKRDDVGNASTRKQKESAWEKHFKPKIGHIPYGELHYDDVADIIAEVAENTPIHANHLVSYIKRCFRWAVTKGRTFTRLENDPLRDLIQPADPRARDRALDEQEIIWFFKTAAAFDDFDGIATALTLILYNGVRRTEMLRMPWDEYTESSGQWLIPGERTKNGDPLLLPLCSTSQELLKARRSVSGNHTYVFPAGRGDGPVSGSSKRITAFREAMLEIAAKDRGEPVDIPAWGMHDLRRTLSTGMNGLTTPEGDPLVPAEIVERVLNHRIAGVAATYNHHQYRMEKKRALELWGKRLDELRARALGTNVATLAA